MNTSMMMMTILISGLDTLQELGGPNVVSLSPCIFFFVAPRACIEEKRFNRRVTGYDCLLTSHQESATVDLKVDLGIMVSHKL